jgi:DUF1365 family protein
VNTLGLDQPLIRPIDKGPIDAEPDRSRAVPPAAPALYIGSLRHRRFGPVAHAFSTKLFLVCLDVDEVTDALDPLPFWSARNPAPIRFRRRDYLDGSERPLGDAVRDLVESRTGRRPLGSIRLLTQLRIAGWVFNPLSVYFCVSADGARVETLVLEVTNTPWKQRCWYVVPVDPADPEGPWDFAKTMHVSPFLDMDLTYRLRCTTSTDRLTLRLEDRRGNEKVFDADLSLRRVDLDRRNALTVPIRHPFLTWRVTAAIHTHALRLWRKGVPVQPHPTSSSTLSKGCTRSD